MHQINPNKLLLSKWTSTSPKQKEQYFIMTKLIRDEQDTVIECIIEAALSHQEYTIPWRDLTSSEHWKP